MKNNKTDKYEETACEFKNEKECEEELDEEEESLDKAEEEHFEEDENDAWE